MEEKLTLKNKTNILNIKIYRENGEYTGNDLTFNLKDIEVVGRYDEMLTQLYKNQEWYNNQQIIIKKQQDFKNKNSFMTNNEKLLYEANKEYLKKQAKTFDLFLGENGVNKLLDNGTFDIDSIELIKEYIEEQILPKLKITKENIQKEIKEKYKVNVEEEVLE